MNSPAKPRRRFSAEERYLMSCYGLVSDMPKCHPATNNAGQILHVTASELAKLQEQEPDAGWRSVK
jgi:hypothetical protein